MAILNCYSTQIWISGNNSDNHIFPQESENGGMNGSVYWDTDYIVQGRSSDPSVQQLQKYFIWDWHYTTKIRTTVLPGIQSSAAREKLLGKNNLKLFPVKLSSIYSDIDSLILLCDTQRVK